MNRLFPLAILTVLTALLLGCGPNKKEVATRDHLHAFHGALMDYREENGSWPETLEDLRANLSDFDALMVNPITGDNPGYRYTKPVPKGRRASSTDEESGEFERDDEDEPSRDVMLVQLRNGEPDLSLKKLYSDGSVRK